jgi:bifunctional DNase/RNase
MSEEKRPDEFPEEPYRFSEFGEGFSLKPDPQWEKWFADRAGEMENLKPRKLYEKEVKVMAVYEQTSITGQKAYFVLLRDNYNREIKIYVGYPEATSISMVSEGISFVRPLTHDLLKNVIERLGWKVERVTIDDLYNDTFYAKLTLVNDDRMIDIDCRPSDAIALALRAKAPIYVAEDVIRAVVEETGEGEKPPE